MFWALADHIAEGVLVVDAGAARVTFANRQLAAALGCAPEELVGRPLSDLESSTALMPLLERLAEGESSLPEQRLRRRDGSTYAADVSARTVLHDGRRYLMGIFVDNSARRRIEEVLRDAGELARLGGWEFDPATNAGVWTEEAARIFDVTGGAITVEYGLGFFAGRARTRLEQTVGAAIAHGTPYDLELPCHSATGRPMWIRTICHPVVRDGAVVRVRGSVQDITDQRQQAEARCRSEALFATVFQRSPVGIVITRLGDGCIVDVNDAYAAALDYRRDQLIGHTTQALDIWVDPEDRVRMLARMNEEGRVRAFETRLRCRSGELRTMLLAVEAIELDGQPVLLGIANDISPLKAIEARLRVSEERLRAIIDSAESLIWVKDLDGRFLIVNRATELALRRPAAQLLGRSVFDLFPPEMALSCAEHDRQVIESGLPLEVEEQIPFADGPHTFLTVRTPLRDGVGGIYGVTAICTDISDRKRDEDAVHEANLRLEQRVRDRTAELEAANRELEAFAYSVSHDLRAPLRAMDGFSLALLEDNAAQLDAAGHAHLTRVRAAAQRMSDLIDNLLLLSRVARAELCRDTVDLSALAHLVAADLHAAHPARDVELHIADGLRARGDERLLRLVLENLLGNAWKFTAGRTPAVIELGARSMPSPDGTGVAPTYYVRDNGAGFDMAHAGKLFQPFQRLHTVIEFPGSGVGLASVQRIIRRHGGQVWAEGAVDRGAIVYFTL
jgi:PAS domain S-box-containing protein